MPILKRIFKAEKAPKRCAAAEKSGSGMVIPDYAIDRIARCLLPMIQQYLFLYSKKIYAEDKR